ncbi:MAG: hypothetical protein ACPGC1_03395 [Pseudomonadales bacterium]
MSLTVRPSERFPNRLWPFLTCAAFCPALPASASNVDSARNLA